MGGDVRGIGFSGTRAGMTGPQLQTVEMLLLANAGSRFHHGDCVGADAQAHDIAIRAKLVVYIHPPTDKSLRAFKQGWMAKPLSYLARNRDIVDATQELIAAPMEADEQPKGGTWSTIRYARKVGKPVTIVRPDGTTL